MTTHAGIPERSSGCISSQVQDDADIRWFEEVWSRVRSEPGSLDGVGAITRLAGSGATRLARLFRVHGHTTPEAALLRARIDHAARELLTTDRRFVDIALDAGFDSSSAFHASFRDSMRLSPRAYRAMAERKEFALLLPGDFRHADTLRQLGRDVPAPDQRVAGSRVAKAVWLCGRPALLRLQIGRRLVRCEIGSRRRLGPDEMAAAHDMAVRLLGLHADPAAFERRARRDRDRRRLVKPRPGLRVLQNSSPFEALCWSIIGQQINLALAFRCRSAMFDLADLPVIDGLRPHPGPAAVAGIAPRALRQRQFSGRKIEYLQDTSVAIEAGELSLAALAAGSAVRAERRLLELRGIGPWSSNYVMMRGFGMGDCAPIGDTGITSALQAWLELAVRPDAAATRRLLEPFAPHRSLACWHLWRSLDEAEEARPHDR